jgi:flavodoxin
MERNHHEKATLKAVIICDSSFGNTEQVAKAIAGAIEAPDQTHLLRVSEAKPDLLRGADLVIVGSPT